MLADSTPVVNRCATHWVGTDRNIRVANGIHVENFAKLRNVVIAKVKLHRKRSGTTNLAHAAENDFVGASGNPISGI